MSLLHRLCRRSSLAATSPAPINCIESLLADVRWPIWLKGRAWLSEVPTKDPSLPSFDTVAYSPEEHANLLTLPGVVLRPPEETVGRSQPYVKLELVCPVGRGTFYDTIKVFFKDSLMKRVCSHVNANDEVIVKGELHSFNGRMSIQGTAFAFLEKGTGPVPMEEVALKLKEAQKHDKAGTVSSKPLATCLKMYNEGMDWIAIAEEVGVKPSTVLGYIGDCYGDGKDVDIDKLCKDAMLGVSGSSEFLDVDVFVDAIKNVVPQDSGKTYMTRDKLGDVVKKVKRTAASDKLELQEEIGRKRDIGALVYAQARIVHGMMVRGALRGTEKAAGERVPAPF